MDKNKAIDIIENIVIENFYKNNHQDLIYIIGDIHFLNTISPIFGRCTKVKRYVYDFYFNIPAIEKMTEEQVRELAIHEVAHALHQMRYNQHGHTELFFDICKELGSKNPSTYWEEKLDSCYMIARYVYKCPTCGQVCITKTNMNKYICGNCKEKFELIKDFGRKRWFSKEEYKELKLLGSKFE